MKELLVTKIDVQHLELPAIGNVMDKQCEMHLIDCVNWGEYPHKPIVSFKVAYAANNFFIKYSVADEYIRAIETEPNSRVWEDSCLEFFCSFNEGSYYNFETNCIGTQLLGWRQGVQPVKHASISVIHIINRFASLGSKPIMGSNEMGKYELIVAIPCEAFFMDKIVFKKGFSFKANFYKCGDNTRIPHFLSWNKIESEKPNFHLPGYFGQVVLD